MNPSPSSLKQKKSAGRNRVSSKNSLPKLSQILHSHHSPQLL